jgi:hypothetical protein
VIPVHRSFETLFTTKQPADVTARNVAWKTRFGFQCAPKSTTFQTYVLLFRQTVSLSLEFSRRWSCPLRCRSWLLKFRRYITLPSSDLQIIKRETYCYRHIYAISMTEEYSPVMSVEPIHKFSLNLLPTLHYLRKIPVISAWRMYKLGSKRNALRYFCRNWKIVLWEKFREV